LGYYEETVDDCRVLLGLSSQTRAVVARCCGERWNCASQWQPLQEEVVDI
jgi:hypothetical protein